MPPKSLPAIVGRKEMAAMLQIHRNNTHRLSDLPPTLQERYGDDVVAVSITPLWWRSEIEQYAAGRALKQAARAQAARARLRSNS